MPQIFSPIQNHILSKLKNAESLRYSELMPEGVPNDLFNYHLQFLVKKGFVSKADEGYALAESGVKHVADPHLMLGHEFISSLFKVNVITIVSRVSKGKIEILNQIRKSHPSFGKIGVPGGIVRKGELMEPAAKRKLKIETGLDADFKIVGMERRIMYRRDQLFSDVLFPIAYAGEYRDELQSDTEFGHNMWVPIEDAIKHESAEFDSLRGIVKALESVKDGSIGRLPFFYIESIQRG